MIRFSPLALSALLLSTSAYAQPRHHRDKPLRIVIEMIEAYLAVHAGVSPAAVDRFDMAYEKRRKLGDDSEPGADPRAPYHKQHMFAEKIAARPAAWRQLVSL